MLMRLILMLLLASAAAAGEFIDNWPRGKTENLSFEMIIHSQPQLKSYLQSRITRSKDADDVFEIEQTIDIPGQSIKIVSTERYEAPALRLISSVNRFELPAKMTEQLGVDTLRIIAERIGDSLEIKTNAEIIPAEKIAFPTGYVTSAGAQLVSRNLDFAVGHVTEHTSVSLVALGNLDFAPSIMVDSVMGKENITISLGAFDCLKVKNTGRGVAGYSYYTPDPGHIPIKVDIIDPETGNITISMILVKHE